MYAIRKGFVEKTRGETWKMGRIFDCWEDRIRAFQAKEKMQKSQRSWETCLTFSGITAWVGEGRSSSWSSMPNMTQQDWSCDRFQTIISRWGYNEKLWVGHCCLIFMTGWWTETFCHLGVRLGGKGDGKVIPKLIKVLLLYEGSIMWINHQ